MIGESQPLAIKVIADEGRIGSDKAVGLGLIVTELVINAIKYAFPVAKADAVRSRTARRRLRSYRINRAAMLSRYAIRTPAK
jgi:two-component sensor histidine kinase